ncbi:MAG: DUF4157 domain-containing protein, partial [Anaerolineae bacterium]|nr:DUF4157 domain-containing protein [Anaerolineae bacterium]
MNKQNQQQAEPAQAKTAKQEIQGMETAVPTPFPTLQRAYADPRSLSPADAQILQRTIGNQALRRLTLQRKMTVGPVGDKYEQEADAVAKQVVSQINTSQTQSAPAKTAQRQEEEEELQMKPEGSVPLFAPSGQVPSISRLQRQEDEEELQMQSLGQRQEEEEELQMMPHSFLQRHDHEEMQMSPLAQRHHEEEAQMKSAEKAQRQASAKGGEITPDIESAIQNGRSNGQTLPDTIRQPMENAFNANFSGVRIHTDSTSDAINRSISARAFTTGQDVFFRTGEYNPGSSSGQQLLAHELTHTIQQGAVPQHSSVQAKRVNGETAVKEQTAAHKIQRRDNQSNLAKIINAGINVSNARGNLGQLGHAMDVWVEIDAGTHPVTPANAKPNTVYGLEFEYWEYVDVPHDNQGAIGIKPWNDIHGIKPDASTFDTPAAGCALTWKAAVAEAAAGTLTGRKKIGFRDIPGLFEKGGRDVERTLQFRIVFNDGLQQKEIFATQLLRVNGGHLGYSAYSDSLGNAIESHGFGGNNYEAGSGQEALSLSQEGGRLATDGSSLPSTGSILATIPMEAKTAIQTFVAEI